jgi:hypothetical protein
VTLLGVLASHLAKRRLPDFSNLFFCNQQVVGSNPTAGFPLKIPICRWDNIPKVLRFLECHQLSIRAIEKNSNWPISKYHLSHVGVVTFVNRSQRVPRFVKSGLALVCNVRLNGSIRWKDYNVFDLIFHTTAEALCFVKNLSKFFTTMFHLVFSFVLIMTQCPASGSSALIGYGGRCTARIVSEETSSPIIIATNVFFKTTREWVGVSISSHSFYGNDGTKFPKKAERRLSLSSSSPA